MKVKCPSCMASLIYDATSGKMECKFCGCFFELGDVADQEAKEAAREAEREAGNASMQDDDTMECNIYSCTACGAELSVNGVEASTFCAYCGQPTIVFSRVSQELKPKWIIPFKVRKDEAVEAIRARFRQGMFIPREVKNFEVERVCGIYIPYWLFDTYYYDYQIIKGIVGSGKHKRTKYFKREADCEFTNLTLDASQKLNDESSQRLEPFEMEELRPFEVAYMSGYHADCFDQNSKDLRETAIKRTKALFDGQMVASVSARDCSIEYNDPKFEVRQTSYALFPAWFMTFRYQDKPYTMLVNGQTGKLVGAVPFDKKKVWATLVGIFALSACVLVPLFATLVPEMAADEDFIKIILVLFAGAYLMGRKGKRSLDRVRLNEKLTSDSKIDQFAHNRQQQQGGTYE
ncbi:MAG: hypothetical protein IJY10_02810 [Lachnospiraceae bacterium]|nr:hypothetical protein [Lachnospiraceae bacterium]